jgi:hypothetical protein
LVEPASVYFWRKVELDDVTMEKLKEVVSDFQEIIEARKERKLEEKQEDV